MIKFIKPNNLNGTQLRNELNNAKVKISAASDAVKDDGEGNLFLDIDPVDEIKASEIVNAHIGIDTSKDYAAAKQSAQAKLAALGLTADEIAALGN